MLLVVLTRVLYMRTPKQSIMEVHRIVSVEAHRKHFLNLTRKKGIKMPEWLGFEALAISAPHAKLLHMLGGTLTGGGGGLGAGCGTAKLDNLWPQRPTHLPHSAPCFTSREHFNNGNGTFKRSCARPQITRKT